GPAATGERPPGNRLVRRSAPRPKRPACSPDALRVDRCSRAGAILPLPMPPAAEDLRNFYEDAYRTGIDGEKYGRWRDLNAVTKADHVVELARAAALRVSSIADVGCGDGALLDHLSKRGFGEAHVGYEISSSAVT